MNTNTKCIKPIETFEELQAAFKKKPLLILGQEYTLKIYDTEKELPKEFAQGEAIAFCNRSLKKICIHKPSFGEQSPEERAVEIRAVMRHEIIHAFLIESGLDICSNPVSSWALNEEMVDWIALTYPKMQKVFQEFGIYC